MFRVPKNDKATHASEGDEKGDGEKGIANGLKDIERYEGNGGSGNGPSYDLGGRGAKSIASPSKEFEEEATIVVDIKVDREGRVVEASIGKGTNTAVSHMLESALLTILTKVCKNQHYKPQKIQYSTKTKTLLKYKAER